MFKLSSMNLLANSITLFLLIFKLGDFSAFLFHTLAIEKALKKVQMLTKMFQWEIWWVWKILKVKCFVFFYIPTMKRLINILVDWLNFSWVRVHGKIFRNLFQIYLANKLNFVQSIIWWEYSIFVSIMGNFLY